MNIDGDTRDDLAVFRPSNGTGYSIQSVSGTGVATVYGTTGDIPLALPPVERERVHAEELEQLRNGDGGRQLLEPLSHAQTLD